MQSPLIGDARLPESSHAEGSREAVWGVRGLMEGDILPDGPGARRQRRRMRAFRAMDRLGLLGEEDLIPTLAARPELRWLVDERGARWDVLAELGRIGRRAAFEEALEWALVNRPSSEEARAYALGTHSRVHRQSGGRGLDARGKAASRTPPRVRRLRGAARKEGGPR